ncbi:MAG: GIN domain-containing protein [Ilyomonas sp.]
MKRIFAFFVIVFLAASCSKDVVRGSGDIITAERNTDNFSGLNTSGSAKIYINYAPEISVKVKGYSNLVSEYITEVKNNTLYLHYRNNLNVKNDNIEVYITMPGFNALNMSGSSSIKATGNFEDTDNLSISTSGNAGISIDKMNSNSYTVQSSGNSNIATLGVKTKTAKVEISGNGETSLSVTDKLEVHISGNGKVSYKGDPTEVVTNISGNGKLVKL